MIERMPGITRLIDRLDAKGLVVRERFKHDRRTVWCRVTPAGLELLAALDAPVERVDGETFMKLEPEELDRLIEILAKLRTWLAD
jgi:DNA-binding MarR family transcriptional regulator